jgi:hypothetical protein
MTKFESALGARNIKFVKTFEDDEKIDYLIQGYPLEGIIVFSKENNGAKLFINIPYTDFCLFSSYFMKFNDNFKNQFDGVLDSFLDIIQKHSNKFNLYLEMQKRSGESATPESPAPISPSKSPETIFKERGFECTGDNLYTFTNGYLVAYINIGSDGDEISFTVYTKNTVKEIHSDVYCKPTDANHLDKTLDFFMYHIKTYTESLSLIQDKLSDIKKICDNNLISYYCLDMDLNNLEND